MAYPEKQKQDDAPVGMAAKRSVANNPVISIFSYCASSILMTTTNKYVLSGNKGFNLNFILLAVQAIVCVLAVMILKGVGLITYRGFEKSLAKKWYPIAVLLVIMIYTSSKALAYLSIPVYTIFKNLTIILIAYGEVIWFGGHVTSMALFSFLLMVLSSIIAAWTDIYTALGPRVTDALAPQVSEIATATSTALEAESVVFNLGYFWMFTNCFASAAFVLIMRKRIKLTNFKDFDTMYYNNLLSIPILLLSSLLLEDWSPENLIRNFPAESRTAVISAMVFSGLSAVGISYCSGWCIRATSSTTYSMVGALNKLPIALSGLVFFGDPANFFSVTSIFLGFLAGLVYAVAKQKQKAQEALQGALPTNTSTK